MQRANNLVAATFICEGALTAAECGAVRELAAGLPEAEVAVRPAPRKAVRCASSKLIARTGTTEWLYARLESVARTANEGFGFEIDGTLSDVLWVAYPTGGFFEWHTDLGNHAESTRKISLSLQLSASHEYSGGGLQMVSMENAVDAWAQGTAIAFPAHLAHRVLPVTAGCRQALIAWMHGPTFR